MNTSQYSTGERKLLKRAMRSKAYIATQLKAAEERAKIEETLAQRNRRIRALESKLESMGLTPAEIKDIKEVK